MRRACGSWGRGTRSTTSPTPRSCSRSKACPADVGVDRAAGTVSLQRGAAVRRACRGPRRRGRRPAQPGVAAAHLRRGRRARRPRTAPATRNGNLATAVAGAGARDLGRRARQRRRGDARLRRPRRRPGRARRGDAPHARRRAGLRGAPARVRGRCAGTPSTSTSTRSSAAGYSVSVFTRWGEPRRPGVGEEPRRPARPSSRDRSCSAPPPRRSTATRSSGIDPVNCTPQLGRPGPWYDRLPALPHGLHPEQRRGAPVGVPRAAPRTPSPRSRRCAPSRHVHPPARCRSPRSARSPPTRCG